jgi:NAD(P)-dependent dehydrogenase (short-subunit alcohol dehydrogenase family)
MTFDLQLRGLRALVTGGTKGVGAAVVHALQEAGVQVMAAARSAPDKTDVDDQGACFVAADLSTAEGAAKVAQAVIDRWGGVNILINTLGGSSAPVQGTEPEPDAGRAAGPRVAARHAGARIGRDRARQFYPACVALA